MPDIGKRPVMRTISEALLEQPWAAWQHLVFCSPDPSQATPLQYFTHPLPCL